MTAVSEPTPSSVARIAHFARALGFVRMGISSVGPRQRGATALENWLEADYHGNMAYMTQHGTRDNPRIILDQARSIIVVALPYAGNTGIDLPPGDREARGFVARYARGDDYHVVLKRKLNELANACAEILGRQVLSRPCVDTAPLLERELAQAGGVGFIAKSTMILLPGVGTYVLLGELLVDVELETTEPVKPRCGDCTSCLDACPTGAFVDAYILDARKCISYLTIENTGPIPREYRRKIGNMIFGCDICQEVCPFNASAKPRPGDPSLAPHPHLQAPPLAELLMMSSSGYRRFVRNTALRRTSRAQLGRNAAVALGNSGNPANIPVLADSLKNNRYPMVRGHAAWALGQLAGADAREDLEQALQSDPDPFVQDEARAALSELMVTAR